MQYYVTKNNETKREKVVIITDNGSIFPVEDTHSKYDELRTLLKDGVTDEATILGLVQSAEKELAEHFVSLSDRIGVVDGALTIDGVVTDNPLSRHLMQMMDSGDSEYMNVVRFYENLLQNPSKEAQDGLFEWLDAMGMFALDDRGYVLGYKGVSEDNMSVHSGFAYVDRKLVRGRIPYAVGSVVTMPRDAVDPNSASACSTGLHIGTWEYATHFAPKIMKVAFNPRDAVSVPRHDTHKLRVCKLAVLDITDNPSYQTSFKHKGLWLENENYYDDDDFLEMPENY